MNQNDCTLGCATFESGPGNKIGTYDFLLLKSVMGEAVKKYLQTKKCKWQHLKAHIFHVFSVYNHLEMTLSRQKNSVTLTIPFKYYILHLPFSSPLPILEKITINLILAIPYISILDYITSSKVEYILPNQSLNSLFPFFFPTFLNSCPPPPQWVTWRIYSHRQLPM